MLTFCKRREEEGKLKEYLYSPKNKFQSYTFVIMNWNLFALCLQRDSCDILFNLNENNVLSRADFFFFTNLYQYKNFILCLFILTNVWDISIAVFQSKQPLQWTTIFHLFLEHRGYHGWKTIKNNLLMLFLLFFNTGNLISL